MIVAYIPKFILSKYSYSNLFKSFYSDWVNLADGLLNSLNWAENLLMILF